MPSYHPALDAPVYAKIGAEMAYPAWIRSPLPCECVCDPSASVVYQSRTASHEKRGYNPEDSTYYRKRTWEEIIDTTVELADPVSYGSCSSSTQDRQVESTQTYVEGLTNDRADTEAIFSLERSGATTYTADLEGTCTDGVGGPTVNITGSYSEEHAFIYDIAPTFPSSGGYLPANQQTAWRREEVTIAESCGNCGSIYCGNPCSDSDFYITNANWVNESTGGDHYTYSPGDEFTIEEVEALADEDLAECAYLEIDSPHRVERLFDEKVHQMNYVTKSVTAYVDNQTVQVPTWELDQAAFDAAVEARVEEAETALASAEAAVTVATSNVTDLTEDLSTLQAEESALETQLASEVAELDTLRAQAHAKDVRIVAIKHQLAYNTGLSAAEQSALASERSTLESEFATIVASYPDPASTHADLLSKQAEVRGKQAALAAAQDALAIATANVTPLQERVTACEGNEDALWVSYSSLGVASAAVNTTDDTSVSKTDMRYRVTVDLSGYGITEATQLTIRWRERTWQHADREESVEAVDTYEYTARSASLTAQPGDAAVTTAWFAVAAPESNKTVQVVGVSVASTASLSVEHQGGSAEKTGVYAYTPSDPPRIYRREEFAGSFAGCEELSLPARDYEGHRDFDPPDSSIPADLTAALAADEWPLDLRYLQPTTDGATTGLPHPTPDTEAATTREWSRTVRCGESDVPQDLSMTLSDEFTTAELQAEVDDLIGGDWPDGEQAVTMPSELGASAASIRHLSADEVRYWRSRFRYKLTGTLPTAPSAEQSEDFSVTLYTLDLTTGEVTSTPQTVSITFDAGETEKQQDDWTTVEAGEDELIWLVLGEGQTRDVYEGAIAVDAPDPASYG